jgi:hypothetical protein
MPSYHDLYVPQSFVSRNSARASVPSQNANVCQNSASVPGRLWNVPKCTMSTTPMRAQWGVETYKRLAVRTSRHRWDTPKNDG